MNQDQTLPELARFEPRLDSRPDDQLWPQMTWPPPSDVVLSGSFIELAPFDHERDSEGLFEALNDPEVWLHTPYAPTSAAQLKEELGKRLELGNFQWTVRRDGAIVGMTSYLDIMEKDARLEIGGTAYARSVWAGPVNPEAKLLLLEHAFESLNVGRVQIKTDVRNVRSQQAIARLGAQYEGVLRRHQRRADGTVRDSVLFSVIVEEWPDVKARLQQRLAGF